MSTQEGWGAIHDDHAIPARLRLYMTATPRVFTAGLWDGAPTATMDRRDIFGPVVYRLGMAEAIERGLLADYQVVMPVVGDKQLHAILTRKAHLDPQHGGLRAAALQVAVLRAITDHDLQRVLVFHNRIAAAEAFSQDLPGTAVQLKRSDLQAFWVDGTQRVDERRSRLSAFESADGCTVLSNVRVLAEGIDTIWGCPGCGARRVRALAWGAGAFREGRHRCWGRELRSARVSSLPCGAVGVFGNRCGAVGGGRRRHLRPAPAGHCLPGLAAIPGLFAEHRACLRGPCGAVPELLPGPGHRLGCSAVSSARGSAAVADHRASPGAGPAAVA
ncbi:hypothetical protein [Streptomyces mirabilis]